MGNTSSKKRNEFLKKTHHEKIQIYYEQINGLYSIEKFIDFIIEDYIYTPTIEGVINSDNLVYSCHQNFNISLLYLYCKLLNNQYLKLNKNNDIDLGDNKEYVQDFMKKINECINYIDFNYQQITKFNY